MILRSRIGNAVPYPRQRGIRKRRANSESMLQAVGEPRPPLSAALEVSVSLSIKWSRTVPEAVLQDRHPNAQVPVSIKFRTAKSWRGLLTCLQPDRTGDDSRLS